MKIGILGAGAVGCYYGARLALAGHDVMLVGRPAFVAAAQAGLTLETADGKSLVAVRASSDSATLADTDLVIVSVKSGDTEQAGRELAAVLKTGTPVLSFQNGIDNAERLEQILGQTVIPTVVYVASDMAGPAHVRHNGRGEVILGRLPQSETIAALLSAAGVEATVSDRVEAALWGKLIINCAYNALSAISQLPYGAMLSVEGVSDVMADAVDECLAVARACGIALEAPDKATVLGLARSMPGQFSSTAQDLARHKPSEIDHLNGYILRKGEQHGVATPVNRTLFVMVKLLESRP